MSKNILNIHSDVLDNQRTELLQKLLPFTKGFVLGGGTALALQLSHRKSFDFDFFSQSPISKKLIEELSKNITLENISVDTSDELTFFTDKAIKVTFLHYPFKPYFKVLKLQNGLPIYSVQEIALQKAYTIGRRGEYRDYFDLYTILKNDYIRLKDIVGKAKKVYGNVFDEKMFLEQLVYFGDLTSFDIISASTAPLPQPEEIKKYFEDTVEGYIA